MRTILLFIPLIYCTLASSQTITTYAGTTQGFSGDGGPATQAKLSQAAGVTFKPSGELIIGDWLNRRVREVSTSGIISTLAGTGINGYAGDGGPATACEFRTPAIVTADPAGNVYIADHANAVIRVIEASGTIKTFAGTPLTAGYSGDGGLADTAKLNDPRSLYYDAVSASLYIADTYNNVIRKVDTAGIISTVAGNGTGGFSGDGGSALAAQLHWPQGIVVAANGDIYIGDTNNHRIRKVNAAGIISTIAGTGTLGYSGDGGPALSAELRGPCGIKLDAGGNLFIADYYNHVIRKVDNNNVISTIAGTGNIGSTGDGGPATAATLYAPNDVAFNNNGDLFIADSGNSRIRKVSNAGIGFNEHNFRACKIRVAPNPNCGNFSVKLCAALQPTEIQLYNSLGILVASKQISSGDAAISFENVESGAYFVRMHAGSEITATEKIIITK